MKRLLLVLAIAAPWWASAPVRAAQRTVTLAVANMYCAACPLFVRKALRGVDGVSRVKISLANRTATVTYDDGRAKPADLTAATAAIGYPSRLVGSRR